MISEPTFQLRGGLEIWGVLCEQGGVELPFPPPRPASARQPGRCGEGGRVADGGPALGTPYRAASPLGRRPPGTLRFPRLTPGEGTAPPPHWLPRPLLLPHQAPHPSCGVAQWGNWCWNLCTGEPGHWTPQGYHQK